MIYAEVELYTDFANRSSFVFKLFWVLTAET